MGKGTRSGAMRGVVRIERRVTTQDANGEESPTWELVCERRAEKLPFRGSEIWSSNERHGRVPTEFRMRWPKQVDIAPQMRLVCKGRLYNITSAVDENGLEVDLLLTCDELVGEPA